MKKLILFTIIPTIILMVFLSGCGKNLVSETATVSTNTAVPTTTITTTPDRCAPENLRAEVDKVHRHMREFDDAAALAANMARDQLSEPIANLQKIRRDAEDERIPPCLANLKDFQIKHMNAVINTLIAFMSFSDPKSLDCANVEENTEEAVICQSITFAREQHDQYTLELARVLGLPIVTATAILSPIQTPTP